MRAYAITREGTSYGAVISFTTLRFADVDVITDVPKTGDNSSPWLGLLVLGAGVALAKFKGPRKHFPLLSRRT